MQRQKLQLKALANNKRVEEELNSFLKMMKQNIFGAEYLKSINPFLLHNMASTVNEWLVANEK